ncbi:hypothetical protein IWX90DRAFT_166933 [Phyllosticta citrichinensis]|uniref:Transmembrane protein n=1 Tax=Phyllosticta citrichinensis TaxID=1130410 RepID=A0ABR1Y178_9PEZI
MHCTINNCILAVFLRHSYRCCPSRGCVGYGHELRDSVPVKEDEGEERVAATAWPPLPRRKTTTDLRRHHNYGKHCLVLCFISHALPRQSVGVHCALTRPYRKLLPCRLAAFALLLSLSFSFSLFPSAHRVQRIGEDRRAMMRVGSGRTGEATESGQGGLDASVAVSGRDDDDDDGGQAGR